jgi:hypothetical protein
MRTLKWQMLDLLKQLDCLWYTIDDDIDKGNHDCEDANENGVRYGVSRREISEDVLQLLNDGVDPETIFENISDESSVIEIEERHYGPSTEAAYDEANSHCIKEKEMLLDDFINAFRKDLDDATYIKTGRNLSIAVRQEYAESNDRKWLNAKEFGLLPFEEVEAPF